MRFSIRALMVLAAVVCTALAAVLYANETVAQIALAATSIVAVTSVVHAAVARGRGQALAIGFAVPAVCYAALVVLGGKNEQDPYRGRLWTTTVLKQPLSWITARRSYYLDAQGKKSKTPPPAPQGGGFGGGGGGGFGGFGGGGFGSGAMYHEVPQRRHFMPIAHCVWTVLFGYAGMKYAGWVYARRDGERASEGDAG